MLENSETFLSQFLKTRGDKCFVLVQPIVWYQRDSINYMQFLLHERKKSNTSLKWEAGAGVCEAFFFHKINQISKQLPIIYF